MGRLALGLFALVAAYVAIVSFPQPMFAHHVRYQNYEVWSDEPIPDSIAAVLDDATRRLKTSELYKPDWTIKLFICNAPWRLWFYGMRFDTTMGGGAEMLLTRNIVIRSADIANNTVRMPQGRRLVDADLRPLSYFIAHEAAHILQSRAFGRTTYITKPVWLSEGFADYIGKGGQFDAAAEHKLYQMGALNWYPRTYRRYHLMLDFLIREKGMTWQELFTDPPSEETVRRMLDAR
ncbi:hypothetical protein [Pseudoduganella sp. GCM10020061]|uniref:hypothetical protein n=1 Tax=Pseudoduganella sp. GCM10020061 TaxID=3317345 RepID=UPI0036298199